MQKYFLLLRSFLTSPHLLFKSDTHILPKLFQTEKGAILYGSKRFMQNEQVDGANLLGASRFLHKEQIKGPNLLGNCKVGTFRTGKGKILYRTSKIRHSYRNCLNPVREEMRMNESIRQKHCGTTVGLTPKPAFTARSAAWSCKGLRLRFRRCQSFRFKETGVLNTYQLKGIEHDDENCTALRAVSVHTALSKPTTERLTSRPQNAYYSGQQ